MERTLAALYNPALPQFLGGSESSTQPGGIIVGSLISSVVGMVLVLAFALTLAYLLTGGVQWITSNGDKTMLESARNKITHAIIGLIIVASAFAIFMIVGQFFGLTGSGTDIQLKIPIVGQSPQSGVPGSNFYINNETWKNTDGGR